MTLIALRSGHWRFKPAFNAMSALGQKQTYAVQKGTSALPPMKAEICGALAHVCFVPKADISTNYLGGSRRVARSVPTIVVPVKPPLPTALR
jgi:hypothetical protein